MSTPSQPGATLYTQGFGSRSESVEVPVYVAVPPTPSFIRGSTGIFPIGKRAIDYVNNVSYTLTSFSTAGGVMSAIWVADGNTISDLDHIAGDQGTTTPDGSGTIKIAGNPDLNFSGSGSTLTATNLTKMTPFVVNSTPGVAAYSTVQSAINAAALGGGGTVFVQPGVYAESLSLQDDVIVIGGYNDETGQETTIIGTHTPPTSGVVGFQNLTLNTSADLIFSAAVGGAEIFINYCSIDVGTAYIFNLANWTATNLYLTGCTGNTSIDNSIINNSGANVFLYIDDCILASSSTGATFAGILFVSNSNLTCSWTFTGAAVAEFDSSINTGTLTFTGTSSGVINNSTIQNLSAPAACITQSSAGPIDITSSTLLTGFTNVIAGAGAGLVSLTGVAFPGTNVIAATVTTGTTGVVRADGGIMAKQPFGAFFAYQAANVTNVTGNSASYVLGTTALTELYDYGNNFNVNGTYTAPFTGVYRFTGVIAVTGATVATTFVMQLATTSNAYRSVFVRAASANDQQLQISVDAPMVAGNTAVMSITVAGEAANTDDIGGSANPFVTWFSGYPIA